MNNFVCFKSNKYTLRLLCSTGVMYLLKFSVFPSLCHTECSYNMHPISILIYVVKFECTIKPYVDEFHFTKILAKNRNSKHFQFVYRRYNVL